MRCSSALDAAATCHLYKQGIKIMSAKQQEPITEFGKQQKMVPPIFPVQLTDELFSIQTLDILAELF